MFSVLLKDLMNSFDWNAKGLNANWEWYINGDQKFTNDQVLTRKATEEMVKKLVKNNK